MTERIEAGVSRPAVTTDLAKQMLLCLMINPDDPRKRLTADFIEQRWDVILPQLKLGLQRSTAEQPASAAVVPGGVEHG